MRITSPREAALAISPNSHVFFPGVCAEPRDFYKEFVNQAPRFDNVTVYSGISFGDCPFLKAEGLGQNFRYKTWQVSPAARRLFKSPDPEKAAYLPIRYSNLTRTIYRGGPLSPDLVLIQTSLPQDDGTVSLGISVGLQKHLIDQAKIVVAEFNHHMPVTKGDTKVCLEQIDLAYESDTPLQELPESPPDPQHQKIIEHLMNLIPHGATVQLGVGSLPHQILQRLHEIPRINLMSGMISSSVQSFMEKARDNPTIVAGEIAGDQDFYRQLPHLPIELASTRITHDSASLANIPKFISIGSAIAVDLDGQVNGEMIGPHQISGVGGSMDYIEASGHSPGGLSIIAMPATSSNDRFSRIVKRHPVDSCITIPRYGADAVVTEFGIAMLKGKDLNERARALADIAHPKFRDSLRQ